MARPRNSLFIMCDQLRWDYLSCLGHPHLRTPNIDALAARGVNFTRAFVQAPVCGPSRMSCYTGRYADSHGASWNNVPLKVGELTLGDHLRPLGVRTALVGKTHMIADLDGMARYGIDPSSEAGIFVAQCGFEPFERDDGLHPTGPGGRYEPVEPRYNHYLRELGHEAENPWDDWANAAEDSDGRILSGWFMQYANRPARVPEEHSETPYMTRRAIEFIDQAGDGPWSLHLSYIKPHWPYLAPAPYHAMYGLEQLLPVVRADGERRDPHPVLQAFMELRVSQTFSRDAVREAVIPVYMGLIKQLDDQLGVLMRHLETKGLLDDTLIVFTSDHGDYLGDHWLGEKDLFHDCITRVPMIVVDPSPAADASRGTACDRLVEAIDIAATLVDAHGGEARPHILEGRSLLPLLHGEQPADWREFVVSENDYSFLPVRQALGRTPLESRLVMVRDARWKYVHCDGYRPMLYDLDGDPDELVDLGADPAYAGARASMRDHLHGWALRRSQRTAISDAQIAAKSGKSATQGILLGFWEEGELPPALRK